MRKEVLVSVIVPCYNAEKYISEAILSVQKQSFSNWELIIVDDCSTDKSESIIAEFVRRDSRIKYIKLPHNTGSPAAPRNVGINKAQGDIIALLDSDDIWYPKKLEEQLECMKRNDCSIVYSNGIMIDESGKYKKDIIKRPFVDYRTTLYRFELSSSAVMFKKSVIGSANFESRPKEDFVFWLGVLKQTGAKAYNTNEFHYAYRILPGSRSRNKAVIVKEQWRIYREKEHINWIHSMVYLCRYLSENYKKYFK